MDSNLICSCWSMVGSPSIWRRELLASMALRRMPELPGRRSVVATCSIAGRCDGATREWADAVSEAVGPARSDAGDTYGIVGNRDEESSEWVVTMTRIGVAVTGVISGSPRTRRWVDGDISLIRRGE